MTKKEVVAALRKAFNKSCNNASEFYNDDENVNALHVLELAAEQSEQEGGAKCQ